MSAMMDRASSPVLEHLITVPRRPAPATVPELMTIRRKPVPQSKPGISYQPILELCDAIPMQKSTIFDTVVETTSSDEDIPPTDHYSHGVSDDWKPWPLRWWFLLLVALLHTLFIILIQLIQHGEEGGYNVAIHLPQSVPDDDSALFTVFMFMPIALTILASSLWEIIDLQVRRLAPYYAMAGADGAAVEQALTCDFVSAFIFWAPIKAGISKQWLVMVSSTAFLISGAVLPTVVSTMWYMRWSRQRRAFVPILSPSMLVLAQVLCGFQVLFALGLLVILRFQRSGLKRDPSTLSSLASMMNESPELLNALRRLRSFDTHDSLQRSLSQVRFFLRRRKDNGSLQIVARIPPGVQISPSHEEFKQSRWEAHSIWLWLRTMFLTDIVGKLPYFSIQIWWMFSAYLEVSPPDPMIFKACYTFALVVGAAIGQIVQREVSILQPFFMLVKAEDLHKKESTNNITWDYLTRSPVVVLNNSFRTGSAVLFLVSFMNILSQIATIFFPALWTLFVFDEELMTATYVPKVIIRAVKSIFYLGWIYLALGFIAWLCVVTRYRRPIVPRQPNTILSQMMYLCGSDTILESVKGTSDMPEKYLRSYVTRMNRSYMFQWFEDARGQWRVGIERAPAQKKYTYGESKPPESSA